jgi:FAD synthase
LSSLSPQTFIDQVLIEGVHARYVLVGDDFRFGAKRAGDYAMLDAAGGAADFDVARMMSYEVHGLRVSSSAVREALAAGDMGRAATECVRVELLHKLHDELRYESMDALREGIAKDEADARRWLREFS